VKKAIFTSWEKLEKSIASWEQHFLSRLQISFYSLDMKKEIDVCYLLSTITIPNLFSEA
ncbi:28276_t:CDS:2, partial [Racocetra persica]